MDWLWTLIVILVVVWLAGFLLKIGGKLIHLVILAALIFFLLRMLNII